MTTIAPDDPAETRILLAAERLFAERGFDSVTIRDIAAEAGVTHPLIHYHWSSKRGLHDAVLERFRERLRRVAAAQSDPQEKIHAVVRHYLSEGRPYLRAMVRAFQDGMPVTDWPGGYPGMAMLLRATMDVGPGHDPAWDGAARNAVALLVALAVGWALVGDQIMEIAEFAPDAREAASEQVVAAVDRIIEDALARVPS
jgi:AcrR family transcriptional regulator